MKLFSPLSDRASNWVESLRVNRDMLRARGRELALNVLARRKRSKNTPPSQQSQSVKKPQKIKIRPFISVNLFGIAVRGAFEELKTHGRSVACTLKHVENFGPNDPGFDLVPPNQGCHVYTEIPRNKHAVTPGALLFLRAKHRVKWKLSSEEKKTVISISIPATFIHLTANEVKFRGNWLCLNITVDNLPYVIEIVCKLFFQRGSITFFETQKYKYTWVMFLYLGAVLPAHQVPAGFNKRVLKCVFSERFVVTNDVTSDEFPKTPKQQEKTGNELWQTYSEKKRQKIRKRMKSYNDFPLKFLKQETWDLFFPGAYDPTTGKVTQSISIVRRNLARQFEKGLRFKSLPILSTIVPYSFESGQDQMHHQFIQDAWGLADFDEQLFGNFIADC